MTQRPSGQNWKPRSPAPPGIGYLGRCAPGGCIPFQDRQVAVGRLVTRSHGPAQASFPKPQKPRGWRRGRRLSVAFRAPGLPGCSPPQSPHPLCSAGHSKQSWGCRHREGTRVLRPALPWNARFSSGSDGGDSACSAGNPGLIPGWGRSPGDRNGNPLQYSCLENSTDRVAWWSPVHGVQRVGHH